MSENTAPGGDGREPDTPEDNSIRERRWWPPMRMGLLVVEAVAVLSEHEALAVTTRALVVTGDVIYGS